MCGVLLPNITGVVKAAALTALLIIIWQQEPVTQSKLNLLCLSLSYLASLSITAWSRISNCHEAGYQLPLLTLGFPMQLWACTCRRDWVLNYKHHHHLSLEWSMLCGMRWNSDTCGEMWSLQQPKKSKAKYKHKCFWHFLSKVVLINPKFIWYYDNESWYKTRVIEDHLQKRGQGVLQQMVWSPLSPDLNIIERFWDYMKRQKQLRLTVASPPRCFEHPTF